MTDQRQLDRILGAFFVEGTDELPDRVIDAALAEIDHTQQRHAVHAPRMNRFVLSALAATAVVVALLIGIGLFLGSPNIGPPPVPNSSVEQSVAPGAEGHIVFTRTIHLRVGEEDCTVLNAGPSTGEGCYRSWIVVANQDGTGERWLFPDGPRTQSVVALSLDGAHLIVRGILPGTDFRLYLTDVNGSEPRLLDTGCVAPCAGDDGFAFSPDGSRLAFVRGYASDPRYPTGADSTVVAIMDLSTGKVAELESTRVANPELRLPCGYACGEGTDEGPHWSPDGLRLLYTRYNIGIPNQPRDVLDTATFVVDTNGDNLRQLAPTKLFARDAQWSPNGSLILFTSAVQWLTGEGANRQFNQKDVLYTIGPDGTGVSSLGINGRLPRWTRDGRIVFIQQGDGTTWVADADGQNSTRLDLADVATLTAIGCVVCPAPIIDPRVPLTMAYWVPAS
jgi:hypothetical protein